LKPHLRILLEEMVEGLEYDIGMDRWILPTGRNELICMGSKGHLSVVHSSQLEKWRDLINEVLEAEKPVDLSSN
jgi:hypothetical protein